MWNENSSSSPTAASGEATATSSSTSPSANTAIRQPSTGCPRRARVRARTPYATPTTAIGASCSGSTVQLVSAETPSHDRTVPRLLRPGVDSSACPTSARTPTPGSPSPPPTASSNVSPPPSPRPAPPPSSARSGRSPGSYEIDDATTARRVNGRGRVEARARPSRRPPALVRRRPRRPLHQRRHHDRRRAPVPARLRRREPHRPGAGGGSRRGRRRHVPARRLRPDRRRDRRAPRYLP